MNRFLKRHELKTIAAFAATVIAEREENPVVDPITGKPMPAIVSIEADMVVQMLREIESRRQKSHQQWCRRMSEERNKEDK